MKMYTTKNETITTEDDSVDKRIKMLDSKISRLSEEVSRLKSMIQLTNRATRRQNTDIANLTTAFRSR